MIFENDYKVEIRDLGRNSEATNKAILGYLEDIASLNSDIVGYGPSNMENAKFTWLLADWKLQIIKRPRFNDKLLIKTWARNSELCTSNRDFEIYDETNNVIAKATSKWIFFNLETKRIAKITQDVHAKYNAEEDKYVFKNEKLSKIIQPRNFISSIEYTVKRSDIDMNNHVHNLNYLDFAYEVLPEDIYNKGELNNIRISYKKEIKLGDTVKCLYSYENDTHIITIKDSENKIIHAIVEIN